MNPLISAYVLLALFLLPIASIQAGDDYQLKIEEAKWESGDSLLVVKGKAPKRTGVVLRNGENFSVIKQTISNREGKWRVRLSMASPPCSVQALSGGEVAGKPVEETKGLCRAEQEPGGSTPPGEYVALAINDLGMHCADLDYRIFSILPPYNVLHGQVIKKGPEPRIVDGNEVDLFYTSARSPADTIPPDTITTTSRNIGGKFKSNFWDSGIGRSAYDPLYPEGILESFGLPPDTGLPAPDVARLHLGDGVLSAHQQRMPGPDNAPQEFHGYIQDLPFFTRFPFGYLAQDLQRFAAEGIPILPVADPDAEGEAYLAPYPLVQVTAVEKGKDPSDSKHHLASVRTVLPVASEADCQLCHVDQDVCEAAEATAGLSCNGRASTFADTDFDVITATEIDSVPGDTPAQMVLNAAKINILRLHDAKHGTSLDRERKIVCARCHYSPALDLAHLGPNDDNGKEQTQHITMSRAMHGHHGQYPDLFPDMPEPGKRSDAQVGEILEKTCYACHPGKNTQCLRGAMTRSGIVCQDCHGNMQQVGNDFSADLALNDADTGAAWSSRLDFARRVPWAHEPGCQSCHTGDALDNLAGTEGAIAAADGIRLLQAYRRGDNDAKPIRTHNLRFAETRDEEGNDHLYRMSKGHGGIMCEGCHGNTHAVWPTPWAASNDNLTAIDLQGHSGTLVECHVCHGDANLGLTLEGPHGLHPVGSKYWNEKHEDPAKRNASQCKACHGKDGEGTVLSRTAKQRDWTCKDAKGSLCDREDQRITVAAGTKVSCTQCHENEINGESD